MSGQIYGAYYPRQCPGGSSSGSAVAVDLDFTWAAVGTEVRYEHLRDMIKALVNKDLIRHQAVSSVLVNGTILLGSSRQLA
jgi:hypothetical protein